MSAVQPTLSIIVNCYNGARYLREALDSIYAQTHTDWEIVFWDNQSTDESAEIARSYDGRLRYALAERHTSLGEARNHALALATGEYVAFLDCDDVWLPPKLERQMELFRSDPELVLVYSDSYFISAEGGIKGTMFQQRPPFEGWVYPWLLREDFIPLLTAVVRRDRVVQAGGFSVDFHHAEDWDLFLRLSRLGRFNYVPECLAKYRVHEGSFHLRNWVLMTREEIDLLERHTDSIRELAPEQRRRVRRKMLSLHAKLMVKQLLREGWTAALRGLRTSSVRYLDFRNRIETC